MKLNLFFAFFYPLTTLNCLVILAGLLAGAGWARPYY